MASLVTGDDTELARAFQEVMYAYYMRGSNIQYNDAKVLYAAGLPEEATSQEAANQYDMLQEIANNKE